MFEGNIPWLVSLKEYRETLGPGHEILASFSVFGVKRRENEILSGKNTLWGESFVDYTAGHTKWIKFQNDRVYTTVLSQKQS